MKPAILDTGVKDLVFSYMNKPGVDLASQGGRQRLKQEIAQAAQQGMVDMQTAVLAGMFVDKISTPQTPATTTVAEDIMGAQQPAGLGAAAEAPVERGLAALPVPEPSFAGGGIIAFDDGGMVEGPINYDGGGTANFARGDLVGAGINEPLPGESYFDYLRRRAAESLRGPIFSEQGTMPRMGLNEAQYDALNKARANEAAYMDILSGKAPVPVRSADPTLMREAPPPALYADETTRGTARRVAQGGPNITLDERGVGVRARQEMEAAEAKEKAAAAAAASKPAAKEEPAEDALARRKRMLKEAGVAEDPFAEDRAANAAMREQVAKDREQAFNMALLEAGLGIMGGKSQYAFQNIGEGAKSGVASYAKAMKDIKADEKEYAKIDRDIRKAEDALRRGDVDKALEYEDKAMQRKIQLRGVEAQEKAAGKATSYEQISADLRSGDPARVAAAKQYLGASKTGELTDRFLIEQWNKMNPVERLMLKKQGITTVDQYIASQRGVASGAGGAGWGDLRVR